MGLKFTEWEEKEYSWMNERQRECYGMLCDIFLGAHHVFGTIRYSGPNGIFINVQHAHYLSTFDYDYLTRAVIYAHDRIIRFEISPSGPGMLRLLFHKRSSRDGGINERHPTIEQAIETTRGNK